MTRLRANRKTPKCPSARFDAWWWCVSGRATRVPEEATPAAEAEVAEAEADFAAPGRGRAEVVVVKAEGSTRASDDDSFSRTYS